MASLASGFIDHQSLTDFNLPADANYQLEPWIAPHGKALAIFNAGLVKYQDKLILFPRINTRPYVEGKPDRTDSLGIYVQDHRRTNRVGRIDLRQFCQDGILSIEDSRMGPVCEKCGTVLMGVSVVSEVEKNRFVPRPAIAYLINLDQPRKIQIIGFKVLTSLGFGKNTLPLSRACDLNLSLVYRPETDSDSHTLVFVTDTYTKQELSYELLPTVGWCSWKVGLTGLPFELPAKAANELTRELYILHGYEYFPNKNHSVVYRLGLGLRVQYRDRSVKWQVDKLPLITRDGVNVQLALIGRKVVDRTPHKSVVYSLGVVRSGGNFLIPLSVGDKEVFKVTISVAEMSKILATHSFAG